MFKKIDVTEIKGFKIGNAENLEAGTGCTVIISEEGAVAGVDVRGGNPATRDTELLKSERTQETVNAVVLSGGSAFGLEAGSGVMRALETREVGHKIGDVYIPTVVQASLYDMGVGRSDIRPDRAMGIKACDNAYEGVFEHGNHGAGTGATVGKYYGMSRAMKAGLGTFACSDGTCEVGAITAVNAFADVYDGGNNIIAGLTSADNERIEGTIRCLKNSVTKNPKVALTSEQSMLLRKRINVIKQQLEDKIAIKSEQFNALTNTEEVVQEVAQEVAEITETAPEAVTPEVIKEIAEDVVEEVAEVAETAPVEAAAEVNEAITPPEITEEVQEEIIEEAPVEVVQEEIIEETPVVEDVVEEVVEEAPVEVVQEELIEETPVEPAIIEEPVIEDFVELPQSDEEIEATPVESVEKEPAPVSPEMIHHVELINELKEQFANIEEEESDIATTPSFLNDPNTEISVSSDAFDSNDDILNELLESIASLADSDVAEPTGELTYDDMGYNVTFNTTIACLITNAKLTKADCNRLAVILHDGYARAIKPVHSTQDGDTIFVMTTNEVDVNFDAFAALATDIIQYSVIDGVLAAEDAYGLHAASYYKNK